MLYVQFPRFTISTSALTTVFGEGKLPFLLPHLVKSSLTSAYIYIYLHGEPNMFTALSSASHDISMYGKFHMSSHNIQIQ